MMDSAIVFTWTKAAPGRESKAFDAFTEAMAFFGTAAHEGKCGDQITFMGSTGHSFMLVPGEYEALWQLLRMEEFREMYMKTMYAVPDIAYQVGAFGQGVQDTMARWVRVGKELELV
jgi:hypothetical protein